MIVHKQEIAAGTVTALFIGKDTAFAGEEFTAQYKKLLVKFSELEGLAYAEQVHGDRVFEVGAEPGRLASAGEGDALFTRLKNRAVLIRTADCIPILFYSNSEPLVGAVHAGWRGLKARILSKTLAAVGRIADLTFVVGPFIGGKSYEVGADVAGEFASAFSMAKENGKFWLDLRKVLEAEFGALGVAPSAVEWYDEDTLAATEWYSARRGDTGRNLSLIFIG